MPNAASFAESIWERICLAEYIAPDSHQIDIQKPAMIMCEVVDCVWNHPYQIKFIDNQANH